MDTAPVDRRHRGRALAVGALAVLGTLACAWLTWHQLVHELHRLGHRSTVRPPDALPVLLWAALLLTMVWASVLLTLAVGALLRSGREGRSGPACTDGDSPRLPGGLVGRLAGILLAITTLSSLSSAAPAFASTHPVAATATVAAAHSGHRSLGTTDHVGSPGNTADPCDDDVPSPGWVPDKPSRTEQLARDCAPLVTGKPVADDSGEVVVRRGDTLWSIAASHLGPQADAQAIAAEWPRWYAANKDVIGHNPDLLLIGTRLQSPDPVLEGTNR